MELSVFRRWLVADGQVRLWVDLPNGRCQSVAASWTGLEAPPEDAPRTHGLLMTSCASRAIRKTAVKPVQASALTTEI